MIDRLKKLDNVWVRLGVLVLFWSFYIAYQVVYGKINDKFNTFGFIYYLVLFIPFTYFLLTDKFQIAVVLIIVLLGINVFTSTITISRYLPKVFTSSLNQVKVLSLLVNFVNLALYLLVILLGIYKLKKDIDDTEDSKKIKNIIIIIMCLVAVKIGLSIYNLFVVNAEEIVNLKKTANILSMLYNSALVILQCTYVVCGRKKKSILESE